MEKLKHVGKVPFDAIVVTADVLGLYPTIPHEVILKALYVKLEERARNKIPSSDLVNMAEFVLRYNSLILTLKSGNTFLEQP